MRIFKLIYLKERPNVDAGIPILSKAVFAKYLDKARLGDDDFTIASFPPGTGGETSLFNEMRSALSL